jgi:hypothetical protein
MELKMFDDTKYYLGELCKNGHDYEGTGKSLRKLKKGHNCLKCRSMWSTRRCKTEQGKKEIKNSYNRNREKRLVKARKYSKSLSGALSRKRAKLKNKYGITIEEKNAMLENQNNKCLICGVDISGQDVRGWDNACIDHNHNTDEVRGLLCRLCNTMLGISKENPEILRNAANYLELNNGI